jgi:GNAT superfamily N-acetyltransferase
MSKPYVMHRADTAELPEVMALLNERIRWLRQRGSDQWNTGRDFEACTVDAIGQRNTWLLRDDGTPIATLTLTSEGDPDFWTPEELREPALYLGKMASTVRRSSEGLGSLMLSWAQDRAARTGFDCLRWDVWRTNKQLQDYYQSLGGHYLRTVPATHRWSGALFQIPARRIADLSNCVITCSEISGHDPSQSFISSLER